MVWNIIDSHWTVIVSKRILTNLDFLQVGEKEALFGQLGKQQNLRQPVLTGSNWNHFSTEIYTYKILQNLLDHKKNIEKRDGIQIDEDIPTMDKDTQVEKEDTSKEDIGTQTQVEGSEKQFVVDKPDKPHKKAICKFYKQGNCRYGRFGKNKS